MMPLETALLRFGDLARLLAAGGEVSKDRFRAALTNVKTHPDCSRHVDEPVPFFRLAADAENLNALRRDMTSDPEMRESPSLQEQERQLASSVRSLIGQIEVIATHCRHLASEVEPKGVMYQRYRFEQKHKAQHPDATAKDVRESYAREFPDDDTLDDRSFANARQRAKDQGW